MKKELKTCKEFERYLKRTNDIPDIVQVGKTVYTMDEYDNDGVYITYGNKRTGYALHVETSNRYGDTKMSDAQVYRWKADCYRNDIHYVD